MPIRWNPKPTREDRLLKRYWRKVGGLLFVEAVVGSSGHGWPLGSEARRIDGVRIVSGTKHGAFVYKDRAEFEAAIAGARVEVIEAKRFLNRAVIGQVIVGADLLKMECRTVKIEKVILCEAGDPALEKVCRKRRIRVEIRPLRAR